MRAAVQKSAEAINYIDYYDYDDIEKFVEDNIEVVKFLYESIDLDMVEAVLKEKLSSEDIDRDYIINFLELKVLEMDKLGLVKEYGSKKCKQIVVDYKLSF